MSAAPTEPERRTGRLAVRIDPETDQLLRLAAGLEHKTLSAFVLDAASARARSVLEDQHRLRVSAAEFARIIDELDRPAEVLAPLLSLVERVVQQAGGPATA